MNDVAQHAIKYGNNALEVDGPELKTIAAAAARLRIISE